MAIQRVAILFDDQARPETTGGYCRRALGGLVEVVHFRPEGSGRVPATGFDLYLRIDDGLDWALPDNLRPRAWWAIDTHMDFERCLAAAKGTDLVFAAQRDGAEKMKMAGITSAAWLPLACDPDIHRKHDVKKEHDVCFVGNVFPGPREDLIQQLRQRFKNTFVARCFFEEMAKAFSVSRVVFNRSIRNDVNMRVFEAVGCGSLLMTNDLSENGQAELFQDGVHLATYTGQEDLLDKVRFYLDRESKRERIAAGGRAEAIGKHTYRHRMQAILEAAERLPKTSTVGATSTAPAQTHGVAQDPSYFDFARPELLALVPQNARSVLEIGCAAGRLGEAIKARQQATVVGVEYDPQAGERARSRLDRVVVGDVEREEIAFDPASFDVMICGDVLEHLREPGRFLQRARKWLRPEGKVIASIPNVRHHSVIRSLIAGNWTYEPAGLLDRTHLRFFTRRAIEDLFFAAGFRIRRLGVVHGSGYDQWTQAGQPGSVRIGRLCIDGIPREEAEEFYVYQYLVTAEPVMPQRSAAETAAPVPLPRAAGRPRGPLQFSQDFIGDFEQIDFFGPPFALVRFADGERAICMGQPIAGSDGWQYPGGQSTFAEALNAALRFDAPDWYIGISDGCCDKPARDWYLQQIRVPIDQVTFSNLFVNWNYRRFRQLDLRGTVTVACTGGDFAVPENIISTPFDIDALVTRLLKVDRPILVAAGPASAIIIHRYWQRATRKQVIVDVGSAIDELTKGTRTRSYQQPGTRTGELVCRW